ncbi:antibiotic ABC transporter ATP-binding protein [Streptomyces luteolifulvus]|uniref:Antibiotic ABC transporter ATP-binding protein n=2 Tax=Streptomyces luteolifulvus TaxID=2615112 RepID=A0A6H9UU98_9ACTN|nr:antibiotic ABC transporter ATP-binding protein [Streptomyces luteolifulvus]
MARVVVVHGIGKEFLGPETMRTMLGPALEDGIRLAGGPRLSERDVACAFYGDLYFEAGTRSTGLDLPPWDESDVEDGIEVELLAAWWKQAARVDEAVTGPHEDGTRGLVGYGTSRVLLSQRVREALDALAGSQFFGRVSDRLLIFALKQVRRYLTEPELREAVRGRLADEITDETSVLVAHSLGSVVAYEALHANPDWPVTDLVTLGSPLGLRGVVHDRLDPPPVDGVGPWPGGIRRWTNIADRGDIVALPDTLADHFGPREGELRITDLRITNGTRMHDLTRYLTARKTGEAITKGLLDPGSSKGGEKR